jgi:hypothetical protein
MRVALAVADGSCDNARGRRQEAGMKRKSVKLGHNLAMLGAILIAAVIALAACSSAPEGLRAGQPPGEGNALARPPAVVQTLDDPTPGAPQDAASAES